MFSLSAKVVYSINKIEKENMWPLPRFGNIEAVFFDLDGTLVLTDDLHCLCWEEAVTSAGFTLKSELMDRFDGHCEVQIANAISEYLSFSIPPKILLEKKKACTLEKCQYPLESLAGRDDFIRFLKEHNRSIAVVTSANHAFASAVLEKAKLTTYIDALITLDDVQEAKPSPAPYLAALEKFGLPAEKALVIEDSDVGMVSAREAKIPAFRVSPKRAAKGCALGDPCFEDFTAIQHLFM